MSLQVYKCLNITCTNDIPEYITITFKTKNDKRRICQECNRKHMPIRIKCQCCGIVFGLTGHILKLYCSDKCRREIGFIVKRNKQ